MCCPVRGEAMVHEVDGVPDGYIESSRLLRSDEERTAFAAQVRELYDSMVEVQITPTWAKVLDFETTGPRSRHAARSTARPQQLALNVSGVQP